MSRLIAASHQRELYWDSLGFERKCIDCAFFVAGAPCFRIACALPAPQEDSSQERPALAGLIEREFSQEGDLEQALDLVRGCEAIPRSRALAEQFARDAMQALEWLPAGEAARALRAMPDSVLSRLY